MRFYDFDALPNNAPNTVIAEYIWIDGTGIGQRSKSRTLPGPIKGLNDIPSWNYDGSSTEQASSANSEVLLEPAAIFRDPFRGGDNILVLCSTYVWSDKTLSGTEPANTNFRHFSRYVDMEAAGWEPRFELEQEYTICRKHNQFTFWPLGWPKGGYPAPEGPYYCSVGASKCNGRAVMEAHYKACLYAGVNIVGTKAEEMPGQWEFQLGSMNGLDAADHMWTARYILCRVAEDMKLEISFKPKPVKGAWSGAAFHTNFSTKAMREEGGYVALEEALEKLECKHKEHLEVFMLAKFGLNLLFFRYAERGTKKDSLEPRRHPSSRSFQ